jgi:hypothetical protein
MKFLLSNYHRAKNEFRVTILNIKDRINLDQPEICIN